MGPIIVTLLLAASGGEPTVNPAANLSRSTAERRPRAPIPIVVFGRPATDQTTNADDWGDVVSMVSLIAAPDRYSDKDVQVYGVLNVELEGNQVCLDPGSLQYMASRNCLAIGLDGETLQKSESDIALWSGYYARIGGRFRNTSTARSTYSGAITGVHSIWVFTEPIRSLSKVPSGAILLTHAQFLKRYPRYRFAPPTR